MAQEFHPGQTVPESGVYRVSHDPVHPDMPHEKTVIKGRRFPACRGCKGISFELVQAAPHTDEVDQPAEPDMAGAWHRCGNPSRPCPAPVVGLPRLSAVSCPADLAPATPAPQD